MAAYTPLTWLQANPATVKITVTDDDTAEPVDLTDAIDIRMYVKASRETDDGNATVLSLTGGQVTVTDAVAGRAMVKAPASLTETAGLRWYRVDLTTADGPMTTAYGELRIEDT